MEHALEFDITTGTAGLLWKSRYLTIPGHYNVWQELSDKGSSPILFMM